MVVVHVGPRRANWPLLRPSIPPPHDDEQISARHPTRSRLVYIVLCSSWPVAWYRDGVLVCAGCFDVFLISHQPKRLKPSFSFSGNSVKRGGRYCRRDGLHLVWVFGQSSDANQTEQVLIVGFAALCRFVHPPASSNQLQKALHLLYYTLSLESKG